MRCATRILLTAGLTMAPAAAFAQDIGDANSIVIAPQLARQDVAGSRIEPGFSPEAIPMGPFLVDASLSLSAGFDTNVLDRTNAEGDGVAVLTPRLQLRANTARHLVQVSTVGNFRRFLDLSSENSEEFRVGADTRLDLAPGNAITFNAAYGRRIEARNVIGNVAGADEPVSYSQAEARAGAELEFGNLSLRPAAFVSESKFSDLDLAGGGSTDLSFRDLRDVGGRLGVGYTISGLVSAFGEGSFTNSDSLDPSPNTARDSDDYSIVAGLRGEVTPLVTAEIAAGYRNRDYALNRYLDYGGITYRADMQWFVTPLVTLRLQANQTFLNSGSAQVAGIVSNQFSLAAYYDPLRNLRLSAVTAIEFNDFRETDTNATRPSLRLQAQYRVNRNIALGGFASLRHQDVSGTALVQEFTSFSAGVGISIAP